jgi:hypothetical protein
MIVQLNAKSWATEKTEKNKRGTTRAEKKARKRPIEEGSDEQLETDGMIPPTTDKEDPKEADLYFSLNSKISAKRGSTSGVTWDVGFKNQYMRAHLEPTQENKATGSTTSTISSHTSAGSNRESGDRAHAEMEILIEDW